MKKILLFSSVLLCNLAVAYEGNSDEFAAEYKVSSNELDNAKYEVLEQAKQYGASVACDTTFNGEGLGDITTTTDNVYPLQYEEWTSDGSVVGSFLVLWGGDVGCMGGTATWGYSLTEFQRFSGIRPFTVLNADLLEDLYELSKINSRFIQDVSYNYRTKNLEIVSYAFAPNDLDNFPSYKYRYNFKKSGSGRWRLSKKVRLN